MMDKATMLEDLAYQRLPCPEDATGAELLLYLSFAALYAYAQYGEVSTEQGRQFKVQILARYRKMNAMEYQYQKSHLACRGIYILLKELKQIPDIMDRSVLVDFIKAMEGEDENNC